MAATNPTIPLYKKTKYEKQLKPFLQGVEHSIDPVLLMLGVQCVRPHLFVMERNFPPVSFSRKTNLHISLCANSTTGIHNTVSL